MKVIMWWKSSCDESHQLMKVIKWWKLSSGESYQVMKVIKWWKLCSIESFFVMKLIWWWKLYSDETYLVMKVKEVEIVLKSDGWGRFACGNVLRWTEMSCDVVYFVAFSKTSSLRIMCTMWSSCERRLLSYSRISEEPGRPLPGWNCLPRSPQLHPPVPYGHLYI